MGVQFMYDSVTGEPAMGVDFCLRPVANSAQTLYEVVEIETDGGLDNATVLLAGSFQDAVRFLLAQIKSSLSEEVLGLRAGLLADFEVRFVGHLNPDNAQDAIQPRRTEPVDLAGIKRLAKGDEDGD